MLDNMDNMARIERDIEKRMEAICEKDGWGVSVTMMPPEDTTLFVKRFSEDPIRASEELVAIKSARAFAKAEFGADGKVIRDDVRIPNTRAPYHVQLRLKVVNA